jgi:NDP-sugar pyrophosphorylase family protein
VVGRAVVAAGYLAEKIDAHYRGGKAPLPVAVVTEPEALGTGGAIRHALPATAGDPVLAVNGDSILALDYAALVERHRATRALATLALLPMADAARFGTVEIAGERVVRFAEKQPGTGLINAGIYVLAREAASAFPAGPSSIERDVLPALVASGRVSAFVADAPFLDIGLPETYASAPAFLARLAALRAGGGT